MSRPYAEVIGDPIAHSKSPLIHNFWLEKLGIDAEYRSCHVRPEELADYFTRRREDAEWRGCNVTIPHKERVVRLTDTIDPGVAGFGAVNTVYRRDGRLEATDTDIDGIAEALAGLDLRGRHAVVFGAGGAARAAFAFLAKCELASACVLARNQVLALQATAACGLKAVVRTGAGSHALESASLFINATPQGMAGQEPMRGFVLTELAEMAKEAIVFDMVYVPFDTPLLKQARMLGLRTSDGLAMLIGQAARAFQLFFGVPAPREHDTELRKLLTS